MDALYARQSADKKDSISIESQIEFCKYETRGGEFKIYTDKGYSGKNTDRPRFQELLQDIKNGEISRVIVYKLDRISRSILDFAEMMQMFEQYGVEFVSSTEKFDTSTPMGRAMLNICIVFAQLERETIQKRVADAYNARSKKGFYMGGKIPYGFTKEQVVIDGIKTSRYVIVPEEAEQVKLIFEMYAQPNVSLADIIKYLLKNDIKELRKGYWSKSGLATMIKNPIYAQSDLDIYDFFKNQGANIINEPSDFVGINGCYLYNADNGASRKELRIEGHNLVIAPHDGFIPSETWLNARLKCLCNDKILKPKKAKNSWLVGKIKCGNCGHALITKKFTGKTKITRYFFCSHRLNGFECPGVSNIHADIVENIVLNEIQEKLKEFGTLSSNKSNIVNPKINELKIREKQIDNEIETLMGKLLNANDVLMEYINKRIIELDNDKKTISEELKILSPIKQNTDIYAINNCIEKWEELSFDDKLVVVDALIDKIYVTTDKIEIIWKI